MSRLRFLTPVVIVVLLLLVACRPADDAWATIQAEGVLRVGLDPTYPPFENADHGELEGIDVDLARALGQELGVAIDFVYFGFDGLYDALATDQVDLLLSALVVDPARTRDFAFSEPYFNAGQFLFVHQDNNAISSMADLNGQTLAVELGSEGHVQAIEWSRRLADLSIEPLPTPDDALWVVRQQEVAAAMVDQISGRLYQQQAPELKMVAEPVTVEPYAAVVRIEDDSLRTVLDEAILALEQSGRLNEIIEDWLGQENH